MANRRRLFPFLIATQMNPIQSPAIFHPIAFHFLIIFQS